MKTTSDGRTPPRFEDELLPVLVEALAERQQEARPASIGSSGRRRRWAIASAAAASAVVLALILPVALPDGAGGADPAAASILHRVAERAAEQPAAPAPDPGEYLYTKTQSAQTYLYLAPEGLQSFFFTQPQTRESWFGPDESGRILITYGTVTFPTDGDRAAWIAAGSPDLTGEEVQDYRYGPGESMYQDYSDLPTDPVALLDVIEHEMVGAPEGEWQTFGAVADLLSESYTVPALRAALYEIVADLSGVEYVGRVEDSLGRPGIAVAYSSDDGIRSELIFDPKTAELLGQNWVLVEDIEPDIRDESVPGELFGNVGEAGTVSYTATFPAFGVVDSRHDTP